MESNNKNLKSQNASDKQPQALCLDYISSIEKACESEPRRPKEAASFFSKIVALGMPQSEHQLWEDLQWKAVSVFWAFSKENDFPGAYDFVQTLKQLPLPIPSKAHSALLQPLLRLVKSSNNQIRALELLDWWGPNHLRKPEDYKVDEGGEQPMSLAEKLFVRYADLFGELKDTHMERIKPFILFLEQVIKDYPDFDWCPYHHAKLRLSLGDPDKESIRKEIYPLVRKQQKQFWVWELLGNTFLEGSDERFACYAEGLCQKSSKEMLIGLRKRMIDELLKRGEKKQASYEMDEITKVRDEMGWKGDAKIVSLRQSTNYIANSKGNRVLYEQFRSLAKEILSQDLTTILVVITNVNDKSGYANTISENGEQGFFAFKSLGNRPEVGQVCRLRLSKRSESKGSNYYYEVSNIEIVEAPLQYPELIKEVTGLLKVVGTGNGFVEDVFVPKIMLEEILAVPGQVLQVRAYRSWDKKKEQLGWTAFERSKKE